MQLEYEPQRLQDWLSQRWVMFRGRRVDPNQIDWLMGPFGNVDVIADKYVQRLAAEENLQIQRHTRGAGLIQSADHFGLAADDRARLRPEVIDFYQRTADHDLEVWTEWNPIFCPFAGLLHKLYSRRLQQLNLPLRPLDTSRGIASEILQLRCSQTNCVRYTIWYRVLKSSGQVIYSGVYCTCRLPDGRPCVKVVFPLPRGNATVMMSIDVGPRGELILTSSGQRFGDPGFYFLLIDRKQRHWAQYIRSFREKITVFVDDENVLRADHLLTLWGFRVLQLHYKMTPKAADVSKGAHAGHATSVAHE